MLRINLYDKAESFLGRTIIHEKDCWTVHTGDVQETYRIGQNNGSIFLRYEVPSISYSATLFRVPSDGRETLHEMVPYLIRHGVVQKALDLEELHGGQFLPGRDELRNLGAQINSLIQELPTEPQHIRFL